MLRLIRDTLKKKIPTISLNTSHVKVNFFRRKSDKKQLDCLNTSHVKVNSGIRPSSVSSLRGLNTSHVKVNLCQGNMENWSMEV